MTVKVLLPVEQDLESILSRQESSETSIIIIKIKVRPSPLFDFRVIFSFDQAEKNFPELRNPKISYSTIFLSKLLLLVQRILSKDKQSVFEHFIEEGLKLEANIFFLRHQ